MRKQTDSVLGKLKNKLRQWFTPCAARSGGAESRGNGLSTAEHLAVVLNGVNDADLHEAAEITRKSLEMERLNTSPEMKEAIANARRMLEENDRLSAALDELNNQPPKPMV